MTKNEDRARATLIDPGSTGIRYFKLYEKMDATAGALAYPCKWNTTLLLWQADTSATKRRIYAAPTHVEGRANDFMACFFNARSQRWEVLTQANWGWGRLSGTLSAGGSATARVWTDESGTMTDSGLDITVYDRLLTSSLATLTRIRWEHHPTAGKYYVVNAACTADTSSSVWGS